MKRNVSAVILLCMLISTLAAVFSVQSAKACEGIIYIRANGSVDPDTAPISSVDNVTYTFTDNISKSIVVQRDNIVIDGGGYTLHGTGSGNGIELSGRYNVTIENLNVESFNVGILLCSCSSNNWIIGNNITANTCAGIKLSYAYENSITRNNIVANGLYGIKLIDSSGNHIYHNNLVDNPQQASSGCENVWDAGYPSGGNYWSDYQGVDENRGPNQDIPGIDGIGDSPYCINEQEKDSYPLMGPFGPHVMLGLNVAVFPDPEIGFIIDEVTKTGRIQVDKSMTGPPPPQPLIGQYYYVTVTADISGNLIVRIIYDDSGLTEEQEQGLRMIQTDIIPGDVNLDGKVNCRDLLAIIRAWGSYPDHWRWNPSCDLNKDNKVNLRDFCIALKNYGQESEWEDITIDVDIDSNIIFGKTDHLDPLDPFGVHR